MDQHSHKSTIQAARAIGIVLVVFAHIVPAVPPLLFPYAFHMPLFFFLSGMALRLDMPFRGLVLREARQTLLFYGLSAAVLAFISVYILPVWGIHLRSSSPFDWKTYLVYPLTENSHHVSLFLVGWFILALSAARVLIFLVARPLEPLPAGTIILLVSAILLCWLGMDVLAPRANKSASWWNFASQVTVGAAFVAFGLLWTKAPGVVRDKLPWLAILAYLLAVFTGQTPMIMAWSDYPRSWTSHLAIALLLIVATLGAARSFSGGTFAEIIGGSTRSIMTWHLFSFAAVNAILVSVGVLRGKDVGVFTFHEPARWWSVYVVTGVLLPMLLAYAYRRVVRQLKSPIAFRQDPEFRPNT